MTNEPAPNAEPRGVDGASDDATGRRTALVLAAGAIAALVASALLGILIGRGLASTDVERAEPAPATDASAAPTAGSRLLVVGPSGIERADSGGSVVPVIDASVTGSSDDGDALLAGDLGRFAGAGSDDAAPDEATPDDATPDEAPQPASSEESTAPPTTATPTTPPPTSDPSTITTTSAVPATTEPVAAADGTVAGGSDGDVAETDVTSLDTTEDTALDASAPPTTPPTSVSIEPVEDPAPAFTPTVRAVVQVDGVNTSAERPDDTPGLRAVLPTVFDSWFTTFESILPVAIDPCAGEAPGADTPPACPAGVGATLFDLPVPIPMVDVRLGWPTGPLIDGGPDCGVNASLATQRSVLVTSTTPLDTVDLQWRTYGRETAWRSASVDVAARAADAERNGQWAAMFDAESFDTGWGLLPYCVTYPDAVALRSSYEMRVIGHDTFGRRITSEPITFAPADTVLRPPAELRVDELRASAEISARVRGRDVDTRVAIAPLGPADDPDAVACTVARPVELRTSVRFPAPTGDIEPPGVYDTASFRSLFRARFDLAPASRSLVCLLSGPNPASPTVIARWRVQMPSVEIPQLVLQGVRDIADGRAAIGRGDLSIVVGDPDRCGVETGLPQTSDGGANSVELVVWECTAGGLPVQLDGRGTVPVTVVADDGTARGRIVGAVGVPIEVRSCFETLHIRPDGSSQECPLERPRAWFELPIHLDGACRWECGDPDAIVVLRSGDSQINGRFPSVTDLDRAVVPEPEEIPVAEFRAWQVPSRDPFASRRITFGTDRQVDAVVRATPVRSDDTECGELSAPTSQGSRPGFEHVVVIDGFCRGVTYEFEIELTEPGGATQTYVPRIGATARLLEVDVVGSVTIDPDATLGLDGAEVLSHSLGGRHLAPGAGTIGGRFCYGIPLDWTTPTANPARLQWDGRSTLQVPYVLRFGRVGDCRSGARAFGPIVFDVPLAPDRIVSEAPVITDGGIVPVEFELVASVVR